MTEQPDDGTVEEPQTEAPEETPDQDADEEGPPEGSVDDVLGWVGDDPEKAQKALDAENESDKPRSTLVSQLEGMAGK